MPRPPRSALPTLFLLAASVGAFGWAASRTAEAPEREQEAAFADRAHSPSERGLEQASRERLARLMSVFAGRALRKDELSLSAITLGLRTAEFAVEANPEDVWAWRGLLDAATLGDPADPQIELLRRRAVEQIARLDPRDEGIRLRRILDLVEREPTAEARIAAYRELLREGNRPVLGAPIAGRLALDLAMLLRRTGDEAGFEEWLAEAATIDPSSPAATAMAAGYFRLRAATVGQEAELLLAAMAANPIDPLPTRGLATLLLDNGAYAGAARFLAIIIKPFEVDRPLPAYEAILTDLAIALWASGRSTEALDLIRRRQNTLSIYLRDQLAAEDPTILHDRERFMSHRAPLPGSLAVARAAILRDRGTAEELAAALDDAYVALESEVNAIGTQAERVEDPQQRMGMLVAQASTLLNAAFVALWLGGDLERANAYLEQAVRFDALSEAARDRFAAWFAVRSNAPQSAIPRFEALTEDSQPVRIGRGLAYESAGRTRDAAREYLAAMRLGPGTLLGVDARSRLAALLGRLPPPEPDAAELEAIAASLPGEFDRFFNPDGRIISLRIRAKGTPEDVFDSIPIEFEIANQSPVPLAINRDGPVRDLLLLQMNITAAGLSSTAEFAPLVIPIDRIPVIPARGKVVIPFDLAHRDIGGAIIPLLTNGCTITLRAMLNWEGIPGGFRPGVLGDRAEADLIRIDGERVRRERIDAVIASASSAPTPEEITGLVGIAYAAARIRGVTGFPESERAALDRIWPLLDRLFPDFDRWTQAWLVGALPDNLPELEPLLDRVRQSDDVLLRLMYLLRRCDRADDPALDAAIRSSNPRISELGRLVRQVLLEEEQLRRRDLQIGPGESPPRDAPGAPAEEDPSGSDPLQP